MYLISALYVPNLMNEQSIYIFYLHKQIWLLQYNTKLKTLNVTLYELVYVFSKGFIVE